MKILHICNDYRDNNLYEHLFTLLSQYAEQSVFVPYKYSLNFRNRNNYSVKHEVCYNDIDRIFYKRKGAKVFQSLKKQVNIAEQNLIHAHTLFSNGYVAYLSNKEYKIDYVVTIRNVDVDIFLNYFPNMKIAALQIMTNAKKIIFISPILKHKLFSYFEGDEDREMIERKSTIITNGIDNFWFENKHMKKTKNRELKLLQIGWICRNKNQINSIKAVELLNRNNIPCSLQIIGGVESKADRLYYNKLINYIERSNYKSKIEIQDKKEKINLIKDFRQADIYLMPSYRETFGLVYIEAMSQGLPIIYSKNQAVDRLFDAAPVGVFVNPKRPSDIAEKIIYTRDNYNIFVNNIEYHLDDFKWEKITRNLLVNIYNLI